MIRTIRWGGPALAATALLLLILPAIAQTEKRKSADVDQAKEMVRLIKQGQLDLADASKVAEQHVKGMALRVDCEVRSGAREDDSASRRLIYDVSCFADDKVHEVQVDGLTKTIVIGS